MRPDYRALLAVAFGGAVGSVARYGLTILIQLRTGSDFPLGTMAVNILGSLLLGFLMTFSLETIVVSPEIRLLLTTGFCGGFTTFSTFSYDAVQLLERGAYRRASLYVGGTVILSLVGTIVGIALARRVVRVARGRNRTS